jgi:hypothetical protein
MGCFNIVGAVLGHIAASQNELGVVSPTLTKVTQHPAIGQPQTLAVIDVLGRFALRRARR